VKATHQADVAGRSRMSSRSGKGETQSLYRHLAIDPPSPSEPAGPRPGPGTIQTYAIETIDNDQAISMLSLTAPVR
jgi:hypothetical protein